MIAGPGDKPVKPQPNPNSAAPMPRIELSLAFKLTSEGPLGLCGPCKIMCPRKLNKRAVTKMKRMVESQCEPMVKKLMTLEILQSPEIMRPPPNRSPQA